MIIPDVEDVILNITRDIDEIADDRDIRGSRETLNRRLDTCNLSAQLISGI